MEERMEVEGPISRAMEAIREAEEALQALEDEERRRSPDEGRTLKCAARDARELVQLGRNKLLRSIQGLVE